MLLSVNKPIIATMLLIVHRHRPFSNSLSPFALPPCQLFSLAIKTMYLFTYILLWDYLSHYCRGMLHYLSEPSFMLLAALVSQKKERAVVGDQVRNFNTTLRTLESPKSSPSMIFQKASCKGVLDRPHTRVESSKDPAKPVWPSPADPHRNSDLHRQKMPSAAMLCGATMAETRRT